MGGTPHRRILLFCKIVYHCVVLSNGFCIGDRHEEYVWEEQPLKSLNLRLVSLILVILVPVIYAFMEQR